MVKKREEDWYWPLGAMSYAYEIREDFAEEAAMLGAITILWNRQEARLRTLFVTLLGTKRTAYAEGIWDRQPTHQARRELLAVALQTVKMTKRKRAILQWVIDRTKRVADRRNELI